MGGRDFSHTDFFGRRRSHTDETDFHRFFAAPEMVLEVAAGGVLLWAAF